MSDVPVRTHEGQRVVITAGAAGIGRRVAERFTDAGARVLVCDVDERVLADLSDQRPDIDAIRADVSVDLVTGFAQTAKHAAQGAALLADGLAGGASAPLVDTMGIREASGTVLDHLYFVFGDSECPFECAVNV